LVASGTENQPLPASFDLDSTAQYLSGSYMVIGKAADSNRLYQGQVSIRYTGHNQFVVRRRIGSSIVLATGFFAVASPPPDQPVVFRVRFQEGRQEYEATYLWKSDLDNYARLTGYVYLRQGNTKSPGLETLFPAPALKR
jgi:hypothetical protein